MKFEWNICCHKCFCLSSGVHFECLIQLITSKSDVLCDLVDINKPPFAIHARDTTPLTTLVSKLVFIILLSEILWRCERRTSLRTFPIVSERASVVHVLHLVMTRGVCFSFLLAGFLWWAQYEKCFLCLSNCKMLATRKATIIFEQQ